MKNVISNIISNVSIVSTNNPSDDNNITSGSCYNGTNCNRYDRFTDTDTSKDKIDGTESSHVKSDTNVNIFRYNFTADFTKELYIFSKIHQYDHRKDFKEAWAIWSEDNDEIVNSEVRLLTNLGYKGDILDKMFKSARYYFRKKSTEKKAPQKRRVYQGVQKELLEGMDEHIKNNINNENYKPSEGFDKFCKENIDLLKEEVNQLYKNGFTDSQEIKKKIKKTYKNRYFLITNN